MVSEEKFFEGKVYGCTHGRTDGWTGMDAHNTMTIACWPCASGANDKSYFLSANAFNLDEYRSLLSARWQRIKVCMKISMLLLTQI